MSGRYWCERALLPLQGIRPGVLVEVDDAGFINDVAWGAAPQADAHRLPGLVLPGLANAHSHAFHRALRGRTHNDGGTFWTWRQAMYRLARRLDPDSYLTLARAVYAEMVMAGVSCVGEFHYLHHAAGGTRYADPNAMGEALRQAAVDAGIRLTLLDTCYLAGGINAPLNDTQLRFADTDVADWARRVEALRQTATMRMGAAIHSVRAVPRTAIAEVADAAGSRPLHVHVSEQPAENEACLAAHGRTPTELLHEAGALTSRTTVVHATHVTERDRTLLGNARATACLCPTTEADLADGTGPARELLDAGCSLCLGSDQHAVTDLLLEARALEHGERLRTGQRGRIGVDELFAALTTAGHASLGWPEAGRISCGAPADLVALRMDTPRTAGSLPEQVMFSATASDVDTVIVGGRIVARNGRHEKLGDVGRLLAQAIGELWT